MLWNNKTEVNQDYLKDWPAHYYEISSAAQREACLKAVLEKNPDSKADQRRLELLYGRFGKYPDETKDKFFHAWALIKAKGRETVNIFNRRLIEKEMFGYMNELFLASFDRDEIVEDEWYDFANRFLELSGNSPAYRSVLFGLKKVSDQDTAFRLANDIEFITRKVPRQFQCDREFADFAEVMEAVYVNKIKDGDRILEAVKNGKTTI